MFCVWVYVTRMNEKLSAYVTSYVAFIIMSGTIKTQKSSTRKRKLYIALYTIVKILIVIILHSAVLYN